MVLKSVRPVGIAVLTIVGLPLLLSGCLSLTADPSAKQGQGQAADVLPLGVDYPGWVVERDNGVMTMRINSDGGARVRQDAWVIMRSPEGDMRIMASYARNGDGQQSAQAASWKTLDTLFKGDGWKSPDAQALYRQMQADYPEDLMLGAYEVVPGSDGSRVWNVGFYRIAGVSWLRGEHVYALDEKTHSWRQVAEDSKAQDFWNELVPVP